MERFVEWRTQVRVGMEKFMEEISAQVDKDHTIRRVLKGWFWEAFDTCHMDEDAVDDVSAIIKPVR